MFFSVARFFSQFVFAVLCVSISILANASVVLVLNSHDATVALLDQNTYKEIDSFRVGKKPHQLMESPDRKFLIVANAVGSARG